MIWSHIVNLVKLFLIVLTSFVGIVLARRIFPWTKQLFLQ